MTTTGLTTTRARNLSYFGARARVRELRIGTARLGERVTIIEWIDAADERNGGHPAGTIEAIHHTGDGQTPAYTRHAVATWRGIGADDLAGAWAVERLTGRSIDGAPIDCTPPSGC